MIELPYPVLTAVPAFVALILVEVALWRLRGKRSRHRSGSHTDATRI